MDDEIQSLTGFGFGRNRTFCHLLFYPRKEFLNQRPDLFLPLLKTFGCREFFQLRVDTVEFAYLLQCLVRYRILYGLWIFFVRSLYRIYKGPSCAQQFAFVTSGSFLSRR